MALNPTLLKLHLEDPVLVLHVCLQVILAREPPSTDATDEGFFPRVGAQVAAPLGLVKEQFGTEWTGIVRRSSSGSVFPRSSGGARGRPLPLTPLLDGAGAASGE